MRKLGALLGFITLISCSQEQPTLIKFELDKKGSYAIQYREADGTFSVMDSLEIIGRDVFEVSFDTLQMISFLPIEGELPVVHAVIGPNTTELTLDSQGFISGDVENNWLGAQRKMQIDLINLIDSLDDIKATYADSATFNGITSLDSIFFEYADAYRARILDSLESSPGRISNIMTVYHRIGQNPVLDYSIDRKVLRRMNIELQRLAPYSKDVMAFNMWIGEFEETYVFTQTVKENSQKFVPGNPFPEFILESPKGESVHLKRMSLDNHVVAIWASWCTECRSDLRRAAQQQNMDNWILLSLDGVPQQRSPLGEWYSAISQDGLGGNHLSDLRGGRSIITERLGVQEMPLYFKVEDGLITARSTQISEILD
tara:strand:- start:635 stop:1750 length:1116 start_codon:yes stop_codon:yes gene_type:complete